MNILWKVIFDIAVNKTLATEHTLKSYFWHYCQQDTCYWTYSDKLFLTVLSTRHLLMNILWKVIFDIAVNKTLANEHTLKSYFWHCGQQDTCYWTYSDKLFLTVLSTRHLLMNISEKLFLTVPSTRHLLLNVHLGSRKSRQVFGQKLVQKDGTIVGCFC